MPVMTSRSGMCPWRTSRRRPSSVSLSVWVLSQAATSASTACSNSVLAPLRKTSVSGSENVPGWVSSKTLVSVTAYHSFGGEVEGVEHPHDTPPYPFMPSPTFGLSSSPPGAPYHPMTHSKIERWHQTLKNRILIENYYLPADLETQIAAFVTDYNHMRYRESIANLTPADVYFGRGQTILIERETIKRQTIANRRMLLCPQAHNITNQTRQKFS